MRNIAVICVDVNDFTSWKKELKTDNFNKYIKDSKYKFIFGSTTYWCIYKPTQLISKTFDGFVETKNAKRNDTYGTIMEILKQQLK